MSSLGFSEFGGGQFASSPDFSSGKTKGGIDVNKLIDSVGTFIGSRLDSRDRRKAAEATAKKRTKKRKKVVRARKAALATQDLVSDEPRFFTLDSFTSGTTGFLIIGAVAVVGILILRKVS